MNNELLDPPCISVLSNGTKVMADGYQVTVETDYVMNWYTFHFEMFVHVSGGATEL